jgi:glycosyltransferase involved in cell wall biosynthesis
MVLHMPWDRNLGAPRVQLELAEEFRRQGHEVDKFDWHDAFPRTPTRLGQIAGRGFPMRAARFVRSVSSHYDIIDAQQGTLPFPKGRLRFEGLLVARSCGLYRFYRDFEAYARRRWPESRGQVVGRPLRQFESWRESLQRRRSLWCADVVNVPNADELAFVRDELGLGSKCILVPNGVPESRLLALGREAAPVSERLKNQEVVFLGHWSLRKGSADWPEIAARIWEEAPGTRLTFLGTGVDESRVRMDLGDVRARAFRAISKFDSAELPRLLRRATVGILPSYVEGFGLGVVEQLAAGIPTVAYDAPGARHTLSTVDRELLTPCGDARALADKTLELLRSTARDYAVLSKRCRSAVRRWSLDALASATLDAYTDRLERIP